MKLMFALWLVLGLLCSPLACVANSCEDEQEEEEIAALLHKLDGAGTFKNHKPKPISLLKRTMARVLGEKKSLTLLRYYATTSNWTYAKWRSFKRRVLCRSTKRRCTKKA